MAMENTAFAEQYPLLSKIDSPEDLKALPKEDLDALAQEIRSYLVLQVTENGGHLASNLGAVELSLAIHRVFSTPKDHVIFDVGHQSYIHKLVTGRREAFSTLRPVGLTEGKMLVKVLKIKDFYEFNFCSNTIVSMCLGTTA